MLGAMLTVVLVASAVVLGYLNVRFGQIERIDVAIDVPPASGEPRNYLLVGSDSRAGLDPNDPANAGFFDETITADDPQRTDTIMILRVDPDTGEASLLSFPRDLFVPIADTGDRNRINVAFTRGREVLIDTIRENFAIPIHHYVEIDFVGFLGLVDAVGGVPFYFDVPVRDTNSGLDVPTAGCISLDARQSLSFARARYLEYQDPDTGRWRSDPSGDLGRISRQQEFIRQVISVAVSKGLSNPATLNNLVSVGVDNVGLDPSLGVRDILGLGRRFASFDADSLETYSLPATPFRTSAGADVLELDERDAQPILNVFRGLDPDDVGASLVDVTVLNGTGAEGFASDVTAALASIGFATEEPGDTVDHFTQSAIYYPSGSENAAMTLARHLSTPVAFSVDDDLEDGAITLVTGDDFTTVHTQLSPEVPALPTTTSTTETTSTGAGESSTSSTIAPSTTTTTAAVGYLPDTSGPGATCG